MNESKRISQAGLDFITREEGCILHPYNDPLNATIGIGHLIHYGQVTQADIDRYHGFTLHDAQQLLRRDVAGAERAIRAAIRVEQNQNQWDALTDLVFNCGPGVLDGQVANDINNHADHAATEAWQAWCHDNDGNTIPDLQRRRANEAELYLRPEPAYMPADEQRWLHEYDQLRDQHTPWARARRRALQRAMQHRVLEILRLVRDEPDGWNKLNRANRYRQLIARI
jgi:GH24 family phage-related lysozyme (muramidase)